MDWKFMAVLAMVAAGGAALSTGASAASPQGTYTPADVALHNNAADCWTVIDGMVLNLTGFGNTHPGGSAYAPYCGTDATAAFGATGHSAAAVSMLGSFQIGALAVAGNGTGNQSVPGNGTNATAPGDGAGNVTEPGNGSGENAAIQVNGTENESWGNESPGAESDSEDGNHTGDFSNESEYADANGSLAHAEASDEGAVSNATMAQCGFPDNYSGAVSRELGRTDSGFRQSVMGLMSNGSSGDREEFCDSVRRNVDGGARGMEARTITGSPPANSTQVGANLVIRRRVDPAAVMGMLMRGMNAGQIVQALAHERLSASGTLRMGNETFVIVNGWVNGNLLLADIYSAGTNGTVERAGDAELEVAGNAVSGVAHVRGKDVEVRQS